MAQLLASPRWGAVATVGRRPLDPPPPQPTAGKLTQVVLDMDSLETDPAALAALSGADSCFCSLGTTRGVAGSADAFRRVDYEYVAAAARAAAAARVPHFALVSAQGANARVWASDLAPFHGLLYAKTKGRAEEAVTSRAFRCSTIARPGLLERGDLTRGAERVFARLVSSVPAAGVAAALVRDAERCHAAPAAAGAAPEVRVLEMKELQAIAKEAAR